MDNQLKNAFVCIRGQDGEIKGCGFCVGSPKFPVTCAHVVDMAIDLSGTVSLEFPFLPDKPPATARVVDRFPKEPVDLGTYPPPDDLDMALLKLEGSPPKGSTAAPMVRLPANPGGFSFGCFGFPNEQDKGAWAKGKTQDVQTSGWLQLDGKHRAPFSIAPGYSGCPVWVEKLGGVIGMVTAATDDPKVKAGYSISTDKIVERFQQYVDKPIVKRPNRWAVVLKAVLDALRRTRLAELGVLLVILLCILGGDPPPPPPPPLRGDIDVLALILVRVRG